MENATKALIMAATILISIVVISLGLYLAATLSSFSAQVNEETRQKQISEFNGQFSKYEGREDLTIHDIITIANLAKENNDYYELTSTDVQKAGNGNTLYIQVNVQKTANNQTHPNFEEKSRQFAQNKNGEMTAEINSNGGLKKYKCAQVLISETTERVYYILFTEP